MYHLKGLLNSKDNSCLIQYFSFLTHIRSFFIGSFAKYCLQNPYCKCYERLFTVQILSKLNKGFLPNFLHFNETMFDNLLVLKILNTILDFSKLCYS